MSILALPRHRTKPHPGEAALLAPSVHAPAATYLRQAERDDSPITFADVQPDRPAYVPPVRRHLVSGSARPVLDELRADLDVVHAIQRAAASPDPGLAPGHRIGRALDRAATPDVLLYPDHGAEQLAAHLAAGKVYVDLFPNIGGEHAVALAIAPVAELLAEVSL